jgi:hypothetical protein
MAFRRGAASMPLRLLRQGPVARGRLSVDQRYEGRLGLCPVEAPSSPASFSVSFPALWKSPIGRAKLSRVRRSRTNG